MHQQVRAVVLYCTAREGQSLTDDNSIVGKIRNRITSLTGMANQKISEYLGQVKDKYIPNANAEGRKDFGTILQGRTLREVLFRDNPDTIVFTHLSDSNTNEWINGSVSSMFNKSNTSGGLPLIQDKSVINLRPDLSQAFTLNTRQTSANTINNAEKGLEEYKKINDK